MDECCFFLNELDTQVGEGRPDSESHTEEGDHETGGRLGLLGLADLRGRHHADGAEVAVGEGEQDHEADVPDIGLERNGENGGRLKRN